MVGEFGNEVFKDNRDDVRMHLKALDHILRSTVTSEDDDETPSPSPSPGRNDSHDSPNPGELGSDTVDAKANATTIGLSTHPGTTLMHLGTTTVSNDNAAATIGSSALLNNPQENTQLAEMADGDVVVELDKLLEFAEIWCNTVLQTEESVTYLRLMLSMSEQFGRLNVERNKTHIQKFVKKYTSSMHKHHGSPAEQGRRGSAPDVGDPTRIHNLSPMPTNSNDAADQTLQQAVDRLDRRLLLRSNLQSRLQQQIEQSQSLEGGGSECGDSIRNSRDEELLIFDQLVELDLDIYRLKRIISPSTRHQAGKYRFLFLSDHIVSNIFAFLPTRTLLCVVPLVCSRFRNLLQQLKDATFTLTWARQYLSDRTLVKYVLPPHVESIRCISLVSCTRISDDGCAAIATHCPKLQSIDLSYNNRVTDKGLQYLSACTSLRNLGLRECSKITSQGIQKLTSSLKLLRRLDLCQEEAKDTDIITVNHFVNMADSCPKLEILLMQQSGTAVGAALADPKASFLMAGLPSFLVFFKSQQ